MKTFGDGMMHITKLRTVTLVKDDNHMIIKSLVALITLDECVEFLNSSNDNLSI